ncbi:MAG: Bcr/CflA family multidrug efflux MFS transporter [Panacagrimonas sp.]
MSSDLRRFPGWLILLGALTALGPLSIDMYLPSFPSIAQDMQVQRGAIERTLTVFLVGLALGQLGYGPLSDRFGRRPPLLAGLAIYTLGAAGCALADAAGGFTLSRLVQALGGAAGMVIARAVIRDKLDMRASARAMSSIMLVMGIAPILAPLAGGWLLSVASWRGIFAFQALYGVICLVWVGLGMVETRPPESVRALRLGSVLRTYGELVRDSRLIVPALSGGFAMAGMFAYIAGSPFVLITLYDIPAQHYGLVFGLNALGLIAVSQLNGHWLRRAGPLAILRRTGWVPPVAGGALLLMCLLLGQPPLALLMAGLFVYVASLGAISPNTGAIAMAGQGRAAGAASAVLGATMFACGMLTGTAMSLFEAHSVLPLASVMCACGLLSWAFGRAIVRAPVIAPVRVTDVDPMI